MAGMRLGYFYSLFVGALAFVTAFIYRLYYVDFSIQGIAIMSWEVFWLLIAIGGVSVVLSTALAFVGQARFASYISAILALVMLCVYIYSMYYYVSVMVYGIDAQFNAQFITCSALVAATTLASYVGVYLDN